MESASELLNHNRKNCDKNGTEKNLAFIIFYLDSFTKDSMLVLLHS